MISTRAHSAIDYGVAAALAGMAASRTLSPSVRRALGAAGAYHTLYSLATDYEGGVRPWLTMRQHLALDGLGAAGLCGAGLLMRQAPLAQRVLLLAIGLTEFAVIAHSSTAPANDARSGSGPIGNPLAQSSLPSDKAGYPPFDGLKPVAGDLYVVDSPLPGNMGRIVSARMTVIRLAGGDLLLHSPTRFSTDLHRALGSIGRIRHLVAPNAAHWTFLKEWQQNCPGTTTWAAPGLRDRRQVRRSGVRLDRDLGPPVPMEWGDTVSIETVPGGFGFREIALFHRPTRSLLLTDLVQNLEPAKLPAWFRPIGHWLGVTAPDGLAPAYLRVLVKLRKQAAGQAAQRLIDLQPERVIFAHGRWFDRDGTANLCRSLRWLGVRNIAPPDPATARPQPMEALYT